jgi:alpha-glucosidase
MSDPAKLWWRNGVIYQIYPRSFQDSDGDGVGDLKGITARLDYLVELGIDAIWISPFYPSPMADFGYDVANYTDVDPLFGTFADFDTLIHSAHAGGLRIILDFVPNHTSDQHPWFLESRSSRTNPKRDRYLWRDPAPDGGVPNNWQSNFGGPGWTLDQVTGQYYYHSFLAQQPDLNWRNPEVRAAMYAAMQFWLDRGVDGFRMDVLWLLIKDDQFRSNPVNPYQPQYTANQPETLEIVREMRELMDRYPERVLIGEIYLPIPQLVTYYGATPQLLGAQMPFNFHLILTGWQADRIAQLIQQYEAALPPGAWPNWVMGNHDQSRIATRIGEAQARVAAVLLLTLRGTPTLYYGDELGMPDAHIAPDEVVDPAAKNGPGRDPERSPMLWDDGANAGFGITKPWLPLVDSWEAFTVEAESADSDSVLALYRKLLELRRLYPALNAGDISEVSAAEGVLSYVRTSGEQRIQVLLNMTAEEHWPKCLRGEMLANSHLDLVGNLVSDYVQLRPAEAVVILVSYPPPPLF